MQWIERQRCLLDFTLSGMRRRWPKHLALFIVHTLTIFILASLLFFTTALRRESALLLKDAPEMTVQRIIAGRHDLIPLEYADALRRIRGVQAVRTRLWGYYHDPVSGVNCTLMVPEEFSHGDDEIVAGEGVLRTWGAISENRLHFTAYNREGLMLKVVDSFEKQDSLLTSDLIFMSEAAFRRITGVPAGFATDLALGIRNPDETGTIARKIIHILPDTRPISREDILKTYEVAFDRRSGCAALIFSGAILAFFIMAWDRTGTPGSDEKAEIGILRAVGWDMSDVLAVRLQEGAVISFSAFLAGNIAAYIHVFFFSAPIFAHILKGWSVLYPEFQLPPHVSLYDLAVIFSLSVVPFTLAGVIPAWKSAVSDPDTIMRQM